MPRRFTPFIQNQYYHFYNRGNNRQYIFFERANYLYFLQDIKKYLVEYMDIIAYCLMPTHYHILARVKPLELCNTQLTDAEDDETSAFISKAMQMFSISYTKVINKRYNRVGALFQGQFQGKLIQESSHLSHICVYIHANPVKDKLVSLPEDWEFSNYLEWINLRNGTLIDQQFIKDNFDTSEQYKNLVLDYIKTRNLPDPVSRFLHTME